MTDDVMRKMYSDWDDLAEERKKQFLKEAEKEMREAFPDWNNLNEKQKVKRYKHFQKRQEVIEDYLEEIGDEITIIPYDCPFGNELNDEEKETYSAFVPEKTNAIFISLLLGIILGIVIIICSNSFMNTKINEFNERFYEKYVEGKEK